MQHTDKPTTTNNSKARDTSVQIDAEKPIKATLIRLGATQEILNRHPEWIEEDGSYKATACAEKMATSALTCIIQDLTSTSKEDREYAKKRVRELVKLGREASHG